MGVGESVDRGEGGGVKDELIDVGCVLKECISERE